MKISKEDALWECYKMWSWLAEHPTKSKSDYMFMFKHNKELFIYLDCYACQYSLDHGNHCYENCIMVEAWRGYDEKYSPHCTDSSSPYVIWRDSTRVDLEITRIKPASFIAKIAWKGLMKCLYENRTEIHRWKRR